MAEERSIFSKLKPISIADDKAQSSLFTSPKQEYTALEPSLKNDLNLIKEKITLLEKTISEVSKSLANQQIKDTIVSELKKTLDEEIRSVTTRIDKEMSELITGVINGLKGEIINYVKNEINISIEKNMQLIESLKSLNLKDLEKLENILSVKLESISKLSEKIDAVENLIEIFEKSISEELKKITQKSESLLSKIESQFLDEVLKKIELELSKKISDIKENLTKEVRVLKEETAKIDKKLDEFKKEIYELLSLKERMEAPPPELTNISKEISEVLEMLRGFNEGFFSDDVLKNDVFLKKYLVSFIELEAKLSKINSLINVMVKRQS